MTVPLDQACLDAFEKVRSGRSMYFTIRLSDDRETFVVDKMLPSSSSLAPAPERICDDFVRTLPRNNCRFGVYNFKSVDRYTMRVESKLFLFTWLPSSAPMAEWIAFKENAGPVRAKLQALFRCPLREATIRDLALFNVAYIVDRC